jgi:hypothetical protein
MPFTKPYLHPFVLGILIVGAACGTLRSTRLDHELRAHGIYSCEITPVPLASKAEPRSTHLRCFRDTVDFRAPKIKWLRSFYASTDCTGSALGSAEWYSTLQEPKTSKIDELRPSEDLDRVELLYVETSGRRLTRMSPDWFLDLRSGCDLKRLELEKPAEIGLDNACAGLFPKRELPQSRIIYFTKERPKDPPAIIHGYWDNKTQNCAR